MCAIAILPKMKKVDRPERARSHPKMLPPLGVKFKKARQPKSN